MDLFLSPDKYAIIPFKSCSIVKSFIYGDSYYRNPHFFPSLRFDVVEELAFNWPDSDLYIDTESQWNLIYPWDNLPYWYSAKRKMFRKASPKRIAKRLKRRLKKRKAFKIRWGSGTQEQESQAHEEADVSILLPQETGVTSTDSDLDSTTSSIYKETDIIPIWTVADFIPW